MSLLFHFLFLLLTFPSISFSATTCPLNITILRHIGDGSTPSISSGTTQCQTVLQALHLVQADYLRRTGFFVPPLNASEACWSSFQSFIDEFQPNFDIRSTCGFQTSWISQGCLNMTTKEQFEKKIAKPALLSLQSSCNVSFDRNDACALCTPKRSVALTYLTEVTVSNVSDCNSYTAIYAASLSDHTSVGAANCLFNLDFSSSSKSSNKNRNLVIALVTVFAFLGLLFIVGFWFFLKRRKSMKEEGNSRRASNCKEEEGSSKRASSCKEEEGNSEPKSVSKD